LESKEEPVLDALPEKERPGLDQPREASEANGGRSEPKFRPEPPVILDAKAFPPFPNEREGPDALAKPRDAALRLPP
jgi:hypothetical protein